MMSVKGKFSSGFNYLKENKSAIFASVIISLIFFILIEILRIIPSFLFLPLKFFGHAEGQSVNFVINGLYGIIMALALIICKKNFNSFKEVGILSFWASLFLTTIIMFTYTSLFVVQNGFSSVLTNLTAWIIAIFIGLIFFTLVFTVISILINGIYFKIKGYSQQSDGF